jgi:hypothetical protein
MFSKSHSNGRGRANTKISLRLNEKSSKRDSGEGMHWLEKPGIRHALTEICDASHQADGWHKHTLG